MTNGIELRHMRYFVALAGALHFGRAAEGLQVSQPLLSRQIRELERLVGVPMLARTRPTVELTPAGNEFSRLAQQILEYAERAVRAARLTPGQPATISLAFEPCSTFHGFRSFAASLKRMLPDLRLNVREVPVAEHPRQLRSGEIDIAYAHRSVDAAGIEFTSLGWERLLLVLGPHQTSSRQRTVPLRSLAHESFLFWHRALAPGCYDYVLGMLSANGIEPQIRHLASDHQTSLEMVAAGLGWTVAPACARHARVKGIAFRRIAGADAQIELGLSRLRTNVSAARIVTAFTDSALIRAAAGPKI